MKKFFRFICNLFCLKKEDTKKTTTGEFVKLKLMRPVAEQFPISSPFGWRDKPRPKYHKGIDFACPVGTDVIACTSGSVFRSGWENIHDKSQGYGLRIWFKFEYKGIDFYGWYGHLSTLNVIEGDYFKPGEIIALSGNSGSSTGPHLHVGFREKDTNKFFDADFYTNQEVV